MEAAQIIELSDLPKNVLFCPFEVGQRHEIFMMIKTKGIKFAWRALRDGGLKESVIRALIRNTMRGKGW